MSASLPHRLRAAAAELDDRAPVSLARLAELHGSAAQSSMLVLLAVPCVLPVPGVGNVLGLALMLMALAMWRGECSLGLPQRVADLALPATWARRVLGLLARLYELAGRGARERMPGLAARAHGRWLGAKVGLMGGLIFLPVPLGNVLPALALVLLGLGLAFRDGLLVLGAALAAAAALAYAAGFSLAAWTLLQDWLIEPLLQGLTR